MSGSAESLRQESLASESLFRIMADCAPVPLWMSGIDAKCVFFNQTWLRFTGRTMEQELGDGWAEGVHPEDLQRCLDVYLQGFNARREFSMEYRLRRADGEYRWVLDRGAPRRDQEDRFAGFIGSCVDITEIRQAHDILANSHAHLETMVKERTAQLERANQEMASFSYSVAHDLRSPLRKIASFAQELEQEAAGSLTAQGRDYLRRLENNAALMEQIIEGLLKLSRISQQDLRREPVDLSRMAASISEDLQRTQPGRRVEFAIPPRITARADPEFLRIILGNLLENSWKFTGKHPQARIELGVSARKGDKVYFVRDDGAGFDMAYSDSLFGVFRRLHGAGEFPGTGIGLATVLRAVQKHGGRIWADAAVERGATFSFTLGEEIETHSKELP